MNYEEESQPEPVMDDDDSCNWMKDSDQSWLENYWSLPLSSGSTLSSVKSRLQSRIRSDSGLTSVDSKDSLVGGPQSNIRFNNFSMVKNIDISQHVTEEQYSRDYYEVSLHAPQGLGMNLCVSTSGRVTVGSLNRLSNGQHSPAQICGIISPSDVLISINNNTIEHLDLVGITDALRSLERLGKETVRLRFRYGDPAVLSPPLNDLDIEENNIRTADNNTNSNEIHSDDTFGGSADYFSDQLFGSVMISPAGPRYNPQAFYTGDSSTPASSSSGPLSVGIFKTQLDQLLNVDSVGGGYLGGSSNDYRDQQMQQLRLGRPTAITAEMIQADIRNRHVYPVAARVTCTYNFADETSLLHELAEEIFEWRPYYLSRIDCGFYDSDKMPRLIRTPRDTGRYKFTQQLEWDEDEQAYVAVRHDETETPVEHQHIVENKKHKHEKSIRNRDRNLFKVIRLFAVSVHQLQQKLDDVLASKAHHLRRSLKGGDSVRVSDDGSFYHSLYCVPVDYSDEFSVSSTHSADFEDEEAVESPLFPAYTPVINKSTVVDLRIRTLALSSKRLAATHTKHNLSSQLYVSETVTQKLKNTYHVITLNHDEVRNMLRCEPETIIAELIHSLDHNYDEYKVATTTTGSVGKQDRPRSQQVRNSLTAAPKHYETGIEVHLPPYDITYLIFYAMLYKLTPILLTSDEIVKVLRKWMDLFNPDSILQTKQTHSTVRSAPPALASHAGSKYDFLIYYQNNLSTVTNIKGYLEVISDLLTLYFLLNTGKSHLTIATNVPLSAVAAVSMEVVTTDGVKVIAKPPPPASRTAKFCCLAYLPVLVDFVGYSDIADSKGIRGGALVSTWTDHTASEYVNLYRELLQLDIAAALCAVMELPLTTEYLLAMTSANEPFVDASVLLKELVSRTTTTSRQSNSTYSPLSSAQYIIDRCQESVYSEFNLMFCLYLRHIAQIFRTNDLLATELSVLYFPHASPWVVKYSIFGDTHHENIFIPFQKVFKQCDDLTQQEMQTTARWSVGSKTDKIDSEWLLSCHIKYNTYLTALFTSAPPPQVKKLCSNSALVTEWLQSCLYIDTFHKLRVSVCQHPHLQSTSKIEGASATSSNVYLNIAHNIITAEDGLYTFDMLHCAEMCNKYHYCDGVVHFVSRWLNEHCRLAVLVHSELNQLSKQSTAVTTTVQYSSEIGSNKVVDRVGVDISTSFTKLQDILTKCILSSLLRLVEPAATLNLICSHSLATVSQSKSPTFNDLLHIQTCKSLKILRLLLYCSKLHESSGLLENDLMTILSAVENCKKARKRIHSESLDRAVAMHSRTQKTVVVKLIAILSPLIKSVQEYASRAFSLCKSDISSSSSSALSPPHSLYQERDMMTNIACEIALIFVHALGLKCGLAISHSQGSIKSYLTDQFYNIVVNCNRSGNSADLLDEK